MENFQPPKHLISDFGELFTHDTTGVEDTLAYCSFRTNTCTTYDEATSIPEALGRYAPQIAARSYDEVSASAVLDNSSDLLEAGIRKWTGAGTTQDLDAAERWWLQILTAADHPKQAVSRRVRAHALSCLAASQWEKRTDDNNQSWNIDAVERAGFFADGAASFGFISPTVLLVGSRVKEIINAPTLPGVDYRGHLQRFRNFDFLLAAVARREKEMMAETLNHNVKVSKAPNAYRCAAPGCGIEATKKSGLLRCAGRCPIEIKPSYCSKECQKAHWRAHRPLCKPNAASNDSSQDPEDVISISTASMERIDHRTKGKEHSLDMPAPGGKTIKMTSTTMSPAFMKELRDTIDVELIKGEL
ncbi:hypothetical protein QCA50_011441 [Cerrena zonata]|uniref:MYND-type domain-containing protein n=1 Tax=Cerrena zonata TaxID=2478898 RepID=A0AAW0G1L9_9APHY